LINNSIKDDLKAEKLKKVAIIMNQRTEVCFKVSRPQEQSEYKALQIYLILL